MALMKRRVALMKLLAKFLMYFMMVSLHCYITTNRLVFKDTKETSSRLYNPKRMLEEYQSLTHITGKINKILFIPVIKLTRTVFDVKLEYMYSSYQYVNIIKRLKRLNADTHTKLLGGIVRKYC